MNLVYYKRKTRKLQKRVHELEAEIEALKLSPPIPAKVKKEPVEPKEKPEAAPKAKADKPKKSKKGKNA